MPKRVAVIGAGTIGASWAAYFLARGFEVSAYDPSPNGEAFARRFIDNAWPTLEKLGTVQPGADRTRFDIFQGSGGRRQGRGLRAGKRAGARRHQDRSVRHARRGGASGNGHCHQLIGAAGQPREHEVQAPRTLRDRPSIQSAASHSAGRGGGRPEDLGRRRSSRRWTSISRPARSRSTSRRKWRAMSPTACRPRSGARPFTSWPKAWCRFRMPMPRSPMAPACAGR